MYDSVIIGCGPAGMTSAIYLARANKKVLILECESIGGQMGSAPLIENYPGYKSIVGSELAYKMFESVEELGVEVELERADRITKEEDNTFTIEAGTKTFKSRSVIVATGSKNRTLGLKSEEEFIGNGISFCVNCDGAFYKDKIVAVVGGANSAFGNALMLSDICKKVYLIHHNENLKAEPLLIDRVKERDNIELITSASIKEYYGSDTLEGIVLSTKDGDIKKEVSGVFLSIGTVPESFLVKDLLDVDERGFISSADGTTSIPGLFVAGDCRTKKIRQITVATSDGTNAAIGAIEYLNSLEQRLIQN